MIILLHKRSWLVQLILLHILNRFKHLDIFRNSDIIVSPVGVFVLMKNVDKSKACGHEGVGNKIVKDVIDFFLNL